MNKTDLLQYLQSDSKIQIGKDKLNKVLKAMGLHQKKDFSHDEDAERIIEALHIIDEHGGKEEGYQKVAEQFGGTTALGKGSSANHANGRSRGQTRDRTHTGTNQFEQEMQDMIQEEFAEATDRIAKKFFRSEMPYQIFLNSMNNEAQTMTDTMRGLRANRIRNITDSSTVNGAETQTQTQGLPSSPDPEPNVDDADFHNQ